MMVSADPRLRAFAALALAGFVWGSSDVASKTALGVVPPVTLALLRVGLALAICWPLARRQGLPSLMDGRLPLLGLIGVAGALLLQNAGLERTGAANGSMLQGATPVLVIAGAAIFLRETPGHARWAGVVTAFAGVAAMTIASHGSIALPDRGDLYVLGSAACFAAFVILGRPVFMRHGTLPVLAATYAWAFVVLAPFAAAETATRGIGPLQPSTVALLLFLGVGCSALAHFLWGYALRHLEASQAAVFDNIIPIVGIAAAVLVLRERPSGWELAGGALVLAGAWIAARPRGSAPRMAAVPVG